MCTCHDDTGARHCRRGWRAANVQYMSAQSASNPLEELPGAGWLLITAGAISIVAGLLAIAYPDITLLALAIFTGVNLIMLSVLSLVEAFSRDSDGGSKALSAVLGVLGLIAGLIVLRRPGETLLALLLVVGIWLVVSGAVHLFRAVEQREDRAPRVLVACSEVVLGAVILSVPDLSLRSVAILAGIGFILRGGLAVYAGWQLRKVHAPASRPAPVA
jgi:uncharacterized membrane protein HdeD (DUF308 family)